MSDLTSLILLADAGYRGGSDPPQGAILRLQWNTLAGRAPGKVPTRSQKNAWQEFQTRNAGTQRRKGLVPSHPAGSKPSSTSIRVLGLPTPTPHPPRGPGRLTHLVPGRGAGLPALTWRCGRPTPASRLSSPLPVAPGAAFPIGQVTPAPELGLPRGAGRAGGAAARWGRRQVRPARRAASPPPGLWRHLPADHGGAAPPFRVPASS